MAPIAQTTARTDHEVMGRRSAMLVALTLAATGCTDTTCPASVWTSNGQIGLATTFHPPPQVPSEVTFTGRERDVLSFADDVATFDVSTRFADWAPLEPGQRVVVWREDTDTSSGSNGQSISLFVTDPDTAALLFGIIAINAAGGPVAGARVFADLHIDYEVACSAPPVDCSTRWDPVFEWERLVVQTATHSVRLEVGDTLDVDGYRLYLHTAARESPQAFLARCDVATGRSPQRGVVIARID